MGRHCWKGFLNDDKQTRLEARARIDIKNLYDRGQVSSKDYAVAFRHVKYVWLGDLSDAQIEEFVREEIRKLETSGIPITDSLKK